MKKLTPKKRRPVRARVRAKRTVNKKQRDRTIQAKARFLSLYARYKGNVSRLCKAAHVGRATYYEWMGQDPVFKAAADAAFEALVDHVETKLHSLIDQEEPSAIYFFLKCRAKNRGYIERQEIGGEVTLTTRHSMDELKKSMKETQDGK